VGTYRVTIEPDNIGGSGGDEFIVILRIIALFDNDKPDTANKTNKAVRIEYWNGDLNSPIFRRRNDGSMVTFKKDSARIIDKTYGNELVVFRGCEVEPNGTFVEYGYYGIFL